MMEGIMKKVIILDEQQAGLVEMPIPEPKADWVLVKMHSVPIRGRGVWNWRLHRQRRQHVLLLRRELRLLSDVGVWGVVLTG